MLAAIYNFYLNRNYDSNYLDYIKSLKTLNDVFKCLCSI